MNLITQAGNDAKKAYIFGGKGFLPHENDKKDYNRLTEIEQKRLISEVMSRLKTDKGFSSLLMAQVYNG